MAADIILEKTAELAAFRLKRNDRTKPLFSSKDLPRLMPFCITLVEQAFGRKLHSGERRQIKASLKIFLDRMADFSNCLISLEMIYAGCWSWAMALHALTLEYNVGPLELIRFDGILDEIARRTQTKEEFLMFYERRIQRISIATYNDLIVKPKLAKFAQNKISHAYIKRMFEMTKPLLRVAFKKARFVLRKWLVEEANRIYVKC
jgi:small-conductance mechanosensitive channel